ncbi:hypothetical protein [Marinobacter changyiensis]|uniref:hypothetical protein n=1 Tax=Marinobacter changyiensis TaxID=2604091 RepID=UPI00126557A7|nr:hypothetical protein [Marinobacter changyiensis]
MINKNIDVLEHLGLEFEKAARAPFTEFRHDDNTAMPAELRNWLVRLRLLEGVPFANLVADSELLPQESIRWFYLDRRWSDALVQGALSVGTVNSDDRIQLDAQYTAIRAELDTEERNVRRRKGVARLTGQPGPLTGFLLRSAAVSGWPGLHVRAFNVDPEEGDDARFTEDDPRRIRLLRLERLAPAVLLCLFDGIPKVVHIEEPRQGIQFGFMHQDNGNQRSASLRPRDKSSFEYLAGDGSKDVDVPFRVGSSGVVDIRRLSDALAAHPETGASDGLDSAEYALQLIRFPWRQVFGEVQVPPISAMFRATIEYESMVNATFKL